MSDDQDIKPETELVGNDKRDFEMFKDYMSGFTLEKLAEKYELSKSGVYKVYVKHKWKSKKQRLYEVEFKKFKHARIKHIKVLADIMLHDIEIVAKFQKENPHSKLDKDTLNFLHKFYETLTKQVTLDEGKPTEIVDGAQVIRHEVVIPQGAKWGVLPPPSNVTLIEKKTQEEVNKDEEIEEQDF